MITHILLQASSVSHLHSTNRCTHLVFIHSVLNSHSSVSSSTRAHMVSVPFILLNQIILETPSVSVSRSTGEFICTGPTRSTISLEHTVCNKGCPFNTFPWQFCSSYTHIPNYPFDSCMNVSQS